MTTTALGPYLTAPDPATPASDLAYGVGGQVVDLATNLAPLAVPFVLALVAIRWTLSKFGLDGGIDLDRIGDGGVRSTLAAPHVDLDRLERHFEEHPEDSLDFDPHGRTFIVKPNGTRHLVDHGASRDGWTDARRRRQEEFDREGHGDF